MHGAARDAHVADIDRQHAFRLLRSRRDGNCQHGDACRQYGRA
jgi:hypothetical protein